MINSNSMFLTKCILILASWLFSVAWSEPIIADHRCVEKYKDIPEEYLNKVKNMLVDITGESHSGAYRYGLKLLKDLDPTFAVAVFT
ncbi:MAG: hypothetical protein JW795_16910, partial [Chitinivibrionales bacterium]|nr:hypothetical protein [Chitinivibrionales bacterium]